ncbi:hypothetical protein AC7_A0097 [Clostridium perfringens NCTC 8239]|nr:hypothetical protein AC7_A0097 [Clostridium perfringens NCTC 8239]
MLATIHLLYISLVTTIILKILYFSLKYFIFFILIRLVLFSLF